MSVLRLLGHGARLLFSPATVAREKYAAFKDLLELDHRAHKAMARLESIYHDRLPVDYCSVKERYHELVRSLEAMGECLERMAPFSCRKLSLALRSIDGTIRPLIERGVADRTAPLVLPLGHIPPEAHRLVGGKAAGLADVHEGLRLPVPKGFVITSRAFFEFLGQNRLQDRIDRRLASLDIEFPLSVEAQSREIVSMILETPLPDSLEEAMRKTCSDLLGNSLCAVRSSAVGEDGVAVSFAGQYRTVLRVRPENLPLAYKEVVASRYSPTALTYRIRNGLLDDETAMAVLVLEMVDARAGGVLYTRDPMDLDSGHMVIYSTPGSGEPIVGGRSAPDIVHVSRMDALRVRKKKRAKRSPAGAGAGGTARSASGPGRGPGSSLDEKGAKQLAAWGLQLESYFGLPQDVEWCEDRNGKRFILQSRPLRLSVHQRAGLDEAVPRVSNPVLLTGGDKAASGVAMGRVARVDSSASLKDVPYGAILVAPTTLPQYARLLGRLKGVVTDTGSAAGHLASVARESGIPCLVNTGVGTQALKPGETVTVDADRRVVYAGVAEELLALSEARKTAPAETPLRKRLRKLLDAVSPLNLLEPEAPGFVPENCRTLHDLLRLLHEKAVREMFDLGGSGKRKFRGARRLVADIPILLYVLDLGGGVRQDAACRTGVTPEEVSSFPFKALWRGLTSLPESWHSDVLHFDWGSLDRFSLGDGIVSVDSQLLGSFALVAPDYMNLNVRFGLHFTVIDALVGPVSRDNYVSLHFKGGGAAFEGKHLRALFLAQVLESHGFSVQLDRDSVSAGAERAPAPVLEEKLEVIGRVLAFTPLLDMTLKDLSEVSRLASVFSNPPALSERIRKGDPSGGPPPRNGATLRYRPNWLTEHLAVGHAPMSHEELESIRSQGIGAIVNLCAEYPELARIEEDFGFEVLYLPVPDDGAPEMEDMDRVLGWMDEAIYLGKKVLIHCRLGIGRTGTFLRSYLIRRGFGTELSEERLKRIHSQPTSRAQWRLLRRYDEQTGRLTVREPSLESERAVDLSLYFEEYEALCREAEDALGTSASDGLADDVPRCGRDTDACCTTPFLLQFMEAVYLWHHMVRELSRDDRRAVTHHAVTLNRKWTAASMPGAAAVMEQGHGADGTEGALPQREPPFDYRCPLSAAGRCLLFTRRPLRCRLAFDTETRPAMVLSAQASDGPVRGRLTRDAANEALHEMSKALFFALNGTFLEGRSLLFPITHVASGKYMEDYFSALRELG